MLNQTQKSKYHMFFSHMWRFEKNLKVKEALVGKGRGPGEKGRAWKGGRNDQSMIHTWMDKSQ
jgi:hypothetical protein